MMYEDPWPGRPADGAPMAGGGPGTGGARQRRRGAVDSPTDARMYDQFIGVRVRGPLAVSLEGTMTRGEAATGRVTRTRYWQGLRKVTWE